MNLSKKAVEAAYERQAKRYDAALKLYQLVGLRINDYRARAVELLNLKRGDCVLDLGCGTGLSFPLLVEAIGPEGRVIGVDISATMLACAKEKIERAHWTNVHLVHGDLAQYNFPQSVNAALSIGVFGYVPERHRVIEKLAQVVVPGGKIVIIDGKRPDRWPPWLFKLFIWCSSPFGLTPEYFDGRTWESAERFFQDTTFEELYGGLLYISSGRVARQPA